MKHFTFLLALLLTSCAESVTGPSEPHVPGCYFGEVYSSLTYTSDVDIEILYYAGDLVVWGTYYWHYESGLELNADILGSVSVDLDQVVIKFRAASSELLFSGYIQEDGALHLQNRRGPQTWVLEAKECQ